MKIVYAFFIGLCGSGSYAIINMLFFPYADPEIGLIGFAALFLVGFVFGLFDYDKKKRKKEEEERRKAEREDNAPKNIVLGVAANKSDLFDQEAVDEGKGREFAKEIGAIFKLTSAKNQSGVEDLFISIANKLEDPQWEANKEEERKNKRQTVKVVKKTEDSNKEIKQGGKCC